MTMQVSEALEILGAKRVIWIDDRFNATPSQLAALLTNSLEIAQACEIAELQDALSSYEFDAAAAVQTITQILTDLGSERMEDIRATFFAKEKAEKKFPTNELSADAIAKACQFLGVADDDKWTFEKADQDLPGLCAAGDAETSYVVDLNESGGSPTRGLDMLKVLWAANSQGTAFILTHETNVSGEAKTEQELRAQLQELGGLGLPVCVIAKERLSDKAEDDEGMAEALRVGVKRAGLRRSMHHVLSRARETLQSAIDSAALSLLTIPPEQLEAHVFERGYKEGVSELHVVERAISAHLGREARAFFGGDDQVQASVQRLRALRTIPLHKPASEPEPHLAAFREAEVWESDVLLNKALTPIACGDVFEVDGDEASAKGSKQKFILLGQPCDISLRPEEKRRAQDTAFLIPLKTKTLPLKAEPSAKEPLLPFTLGGEQWACDFRSASVARLSILDLASFRLDGRVRVDDGHKAPAGLLVAQEKAYEDRTKPATDALGNPSLRPAPGQISVALQLTFAHADAFKYVHSPVFEEASKQKIGGETIIRPKRATWRLRRLGRVRMPYAAALLDLYTGVMSRQAFDLDFMSPGLKAAGDEAKPVVAPAVAPVPEHSNAVRPTPADLKAEAVKVPAIPAKE
ncbi:hypothetical protein P9A16_07610 [Shinella sp. 838]|uniref:hypothetical protein n=1 Tax=Shinella sp. 838 TaxID=3038164 RepID=UPI002415504B|nr:hypothetical protein [Shinella sp. 838]MDG4670985.1 hypothetical protein [Shinella sp. 838]